MTAGPAEESAVLVLGGSGLIGRAVVRAVAGGSGHRVLATYRHSSPQPGPRTTWIRYDSAADGPGNDAAGGSLARAVSGLTDSVPVVALIHCVGVSSSRRSVTGTPDDEWRALFDGNALGFVRAYRALAPHLRRSQGTVVAVGSETTTALPEGNGPYSASKAALEAAVLTLAKEEARHGVRFNIVAPGRVHPQDEPAGAASGTLLTSRQVGEVIAAVALDRTGHHRSGQIIPLSAPGATHQKENPG